ncbi:hypothetical protein FRC09_011834 [Ceratobasidium sp. 395]|nr:hypothetical protein FRC09_011834 [Ceratobasidium sp. 395]
MSRYGLVPLAPASPQKTPYPFTSEPYSKSVHHHEGLTEDRSQRPSRVRLRRLLPTLAVFTLTAGLGLAVLAWLFTRLKIPVSEALRSGYLLVDEGVRRREGAIESATLRALTATSFISTIIAATSPVLMTLIAYQIAYAWITEEQKPRSDKSKSIGPTPLQYGLLLQVLSASSVISLYDSLAYLARKPRTPTPSYFATAVLLGVAVYLITHLVGVADLWLHATTSAALYNLTLSDNFAPLKAGVAFNESRCDWSYYSPHIRRICLTNSGAWGYQPGGDLVIPMGQSIIANYSSDRKAITLADEHDLAIVVPSTIDKLVTFKAPSFGALARCESITAQCDVMLEIHEEQSLPPKYPKNCSNVGITSIPTDPKVIGSVALIAPHDAWHGAGRFRFDGMKYGPTLCCLTNPVQSLLQLRWSSQVDGPVNIPNLAAYGGLTPLIDMYAKCNLTFYNITVAYDGRAPGGKFWSVVPGSEQLSTEAFASTLAGPFAWQLIMDTLTVNIKSRAMLSNTTKQVMAALNQELSRLALGFVSDSFIFIDASDLQIFQPTLLGQYPIFPLLAFVILLFIYGLIALAVFTMSFGLKTDTILVPPSLQYNASSDANSEVPVLEVAQLRLLSPLPLVAQIFEQPLNHSDAPSPGDADAKSVAATETKLFNEERYFDTTEPRLRLGLEDTELRPRFGVWKQISAKSTHTSSSSNVTTSTH